METVLFLPITNPAARGPLDVARLRRRAELLDDPGHAVGYEVLLVKVRAGQVRAQYLAARARLEP